MPDPRPSPPGYHPVATRNEGGFSGELLAFAEDLRSEGVKVGTSEILDTFLALEHVPWTRRADGSCAGPPARTARCSRRRWPVPRRFTLPGNHPPRTSL